MEQRPGTSGDGPARSGEAASAGVELAGFSVSGEARGRGRTRRADPKGSGEVAHLLPRGHCGLSYPGVHWPQQKVALASSLSPGASAQTERGQTLLRGPARPGCKRLSSAWGRDAEDGNSLFLCFSCLSFIAAWQNRRASCLQIWFIERAQGDFIIACIRYQLLLEANCDISSI